MTLQYIAPGKRSKLSRTKAARIFLREGGRCYLCGELVRPSDAYEIEHPTAIADGGSDDERDLRVAHVKCHAVKTKREATTRAKRDRIITAGWVGARKPKSKFKRKINGQTVLREAPNRD